MKTLIIVKPYAILRGHCGEILKRFENKGFRIRAMKIIRMNKEQAEKLYAVHKGKPFYDSLVKHMTFSPVVVAVLGHDQLDEDEGVALVRKICGDTDPAKAERGTIRRDFGLTVRRNAIHASDSKESADYEIPIFFDKSEFVKYD